MQNDIISPEPVKQSQRYVHVEYRTWHDKTNIRLGCRTILLSIFSSYSIPVCSCTRTCYYRYIFNHDYEEYFRVNVLYESGQEGLRKYYISNDTHKYLGNMPVSHKVHTYRETILCSVLLVFPFKYLEVLKGRSKKYRGNITIRDSSSVLLMMVIVGPHER